MSILIGWIETNDLIHSLTKNTKTGDLYQSSATLAFSCIQVATHGHANWCFIYQ